MRSPSTTLLLRCIPGLLLAIGMATDAPRAIAAPGFGPHTEFATGSYAAAVAIGDLNGDGKPDLATANYDDQTASVLLGNGDGTFGPKSDYGVGGAGSSVAIDDLNGDGKLDLVVSNYYANTVSVLLGNGDGTFGAKTDFATGGHPYVIAVGDLNADGKLDVAAANDDIDRVSVLLGNGDGTFGTNTDFETGSAPSGLAIGDLNGDGKPDLATANSIVYGGLTGNTVSVLLGNGDGTFGAHTNYDVGNNPLSVAIGDLNGDSKPDLAVANQVSVGPGLWVVSVLLGDGTGSFGAKTDYATARGPVSVVIGDLDGDGKPDLATANLGTIAAGASVSVLLGVGDGSFGAKTDYASAQSPNILAMGDLNGDGAADLVTANTSSNTVSVLLNLSGGPTPTLLVRFDAVATNGGTELSWQFGEPERVVSASLERAQNQVGPWLSLTPEIHRLGEATKALDQSTTPGQNYYYRLTANLTDRTQAVFGPISITALSAIKVSGLTGIAPNPASVNARIDFTLVRQEKVRISVVDVAGREQAILSDGLMTPGNYSMVWDGRNGGTRLPAGIYFVQWRSAGTTMHRKLVLTQ